MVFDRTTKLRLRRKFRRSRDQVEDLSQQAEEQLEKHFFRRLSKLTKVRRFVASWIVLFVLLIGSVLYQARDLGRHYLVNKPTPGGIYTEGILGSFTNANPLYTSGNVDNSVGRLVFAGLLKYDQQNQLVGDLADKWSVDDRGLTYTVHLRPQLEWQDGAALTSADVVYTYQMIQNPDAKSPLASSWQGIKVAAVDTQTVTFTLPNVLSTFPHSLTNGLIPKHLLGDRPAAQLRSLAFNTSHPIGAGPFKWEAVEVIGNDVDDREQRIALVPNSHYYGGTPKIDRFIIRAFRNQDKMINAFKDRAVDSLAGLSSLPESLAKDSSVIDYNIPLTSEVLLFFKTSEGDLQDQKVRQALAYATDTNALMAGMNRPVLPANGPLLPGQLGYNAALKQNVGDRLKAAQLLDEAGWKVGDDGIRVKDGRKLTFNLLTQDNDVYSYVAQAVKQEWRQVGVQLNVVKQTDQDLQSSLANHIYDVLLYGISLGPDPDVYAYWHSSQADVRAPNRLNFSEYRSGAADSALEAGRTRSDPTVRTVKYQPFLAAWQKDAPAIALYQPRYLYLTRTQIANFKPASLNSGADRLNNVENWMILQKKQPITE